MKKTSCYLLVIIINIAVISGMIFFLHCIPACADETAPTSSRAIDEMSVIVGYGRESISEGAYEPVLLIARLEHDLKGQLPFLAAQRGTLSLYLEPQINPVVSPEADWEIGIGLGLKYRYPLSNRIAISVMGSIGPHYVSVVSKDQANGFIFSDTIGGGLSWFLTEKAALSVEYRFRHLSNASIRKPNGGINNHIGTVGYTLFF